MGRTETKPENALIPATWEACRQWVRDQVFRLRPADYCTKYPDWPGMVGLELEMGVYHRETLSWTKPRHVALQGDRSITQALVPLAQKKGWQTSFQDEKAQALLKIDLDDSDQITFEPGGQVEISTKPYPCLLDAQARLASVQADLETALQSIGATIIQYGINPWLTVEEIGLQMQKPRYRAMDQFFNRLSEYGRRMMRQTCTVQVNLDFGGDEKTLASRYLAAHLMAPYVTGMFAYSPVADGRLQGVKSLRSRVWQGIDSSRTGFPRLQSIAERLDRESCVDAYLDAVLAARVVFVTGLDYQAQDGLVTFRDWLEKPIGGIRPTMADFETHLSLQFMEVRPRGFLELRSIDCQSRPWQAVPGAFYTGILYDENAVKEVLSHFGGTISRMNELWQKSSMGLADTEIAEGAQYLMKLARSGFNGLPACVRGVKSATLLAQFDEYFTQQGRCPADDIIDAIQKRPGTAITPELWQSIEQQWSQRVGQDGRL